MPCAAGELCLLQDETPSAPNGHECRGGCGGRLHGICGDIDPEGADEQARICPKCVVDSQKKSTAAPSGAASAGAASAARTGKRKSSSTGGSGSGGSGSSKKIQSGAPKKGKGASRTRLSVDQKIDILQRLDDGSTHSSLADRYNCGERTISRVQEERKELKERAASATTKGGAKSNRKGEFPKVRVRHSLALCFFRFSRVDVMLLEGKNDGRCERGISFMLVSDVARKNRTEK